MTLILDGLGSCASAILLDGLGTCHRETSTFTNQRKTFNFSNTEITTFNAMTRQRKNG